MIYTHDKQRAISPRHILYVEIRNRRDPAGRGDARDRRVYAVDTNGGEHQLTPYGASDASLQAAFDDAIWQVTNGTQP